MQELVAIAKLRCKAKINKIQEEISTLHCECFAEFTAFTLTRPFSHLLRAEMKFREEEINYSI